MKRCTPASRAATSMLRKPVDVVGVGGDRVFEAARHRAERGLVQHVVDALADALAVVQVADVAFDEAEARPAPALTRRCTSSRLRCLPVEKLSSPTTSWSSFSRGSSRLRADEAGDAGDQPFFGCFCQLTATGCVGGVHGG